jgi:hypothetical protein
MKKIMLFASAVTLCMCEPTYAVNLAVITSPPNFLGLIVFFVACGGVVIGYQVLSALKGGHLSRSWLLFVVGFALLALSQLTALLAAFEIAPIPQWVSPLLMVAWIGAFLYGVYETKRILG